ncbi:MAG: hypothetical protein JNL21_13565 [Myxococcales bacterium]|nr:hypothetical protein [Myxococcales bacterium]
MRSEGTRGLVWTAVGAGLAVAGACSGAERSVERSAETAASATLQPDARASAAPPAPPPAPSSAASSQVTPPEASSLDGCIIEVLRDPFPNGPALDEPYRKAVAALEAGRQDDAQKRFDEVATWSGPASLVPMGQLGEAEVERTLKDPFFRTSVLKRYDLILASKTPHPLREITLTRKAQGLAALDRPDEAVEALAALAPSGSDTLGQLGRCDASVRAASAELLRAFTRAEQLGDVACKKAAALAEKLKESDAASALRARCGR